jgi:hypothetical protein
MVPVLGFVANIAMLVAVIYLGILGGGDTLTAALMAVIASAVWLLIGIAYLTLQSARSGRKVIGEAVKQQN